MKLDSVVPDIFHDKFNNVTTEVAPIWRARCNVEIVFDQTK